MSILLVDSSGPARADSATTAKMNFTWPIGFPVDCWEEGEAARYLEAVAGHLQPRILPKHNIGVL